MLSFIIFKDAPEEVEIVADEQGIQELIEYLQYIKQTKDHMHLVIDSELDPFPIPRNRKNKTLYAKHVRLEYAEKEAWENDQKT